MNEHEKPQIDFMHKLARQIVERRNLVFLFVILAAIFTVFSVRWVKVETDMTTYLPKTSETRMGLDIMDEQFTTYGSADIMVANITPAEADELSDRLTELKGVQMLDYDDTTDHYNKDAVSALYSITFDYPEDDDQCLEALDRVKEYLADPLCGFCFPANGFLNLMRIMGMCYSPKGWQMKNPSMPVLFVSGADDPCRIDDKAFAKAVQFMRDRGYTNVKSKLYKGLRHEILLEKDAEDIVWKDLI